MNENSKQRSSGCSASSQGSSSGGDASSNGEFCFTAIERPSTPVREEQKHFRETANLLASNAMQKFEARDKRTTVSSTEITSKPGPITPKPRSRKKSMIQQPTPSPLNSKAFKDRMKGEIIEREKRVRILSDTLKRAAEENKMEHHQTRGIIDVGFKHSELNQMEIKAGQQNLFGEIQDLKVQLQIMNSAQKPRAVPASITCATAASTVSDSVPSKELVEENTALTQKCKDEFAKRRNTEARLKKYKEEIKRLRVSKEDLGDRLRALSVPSKDPMGIAVARKKETPTEVRAFNAHVKKNAKGRQNDCRDKANRL